VGRNTKKEFHITLSRFGYRRGVIEWGRRGRSAKTGHGFCRCKLGGGEKEKRGDCKKKVEKTKAKRPGSERNKKRSRSKKSHGRGCGRVEHHKDGGRETHAGGPK